MPRLVGESGKTSLESLARQSRQTTYLRLMALEPA